MDAFSRKKKFENKLLIRETYTQTSEYENFFVNLIINKICLFPQSFIKKSLILLQKPVVFLEQREQINDF